MKNWILISLFLLFGCEQIFSQPLTDLRIHNETSQSLTIEFNPIITKKEVITKTGSFLTKFDFFGCQINYDSIGNADFFRVVILLFPSENYSLEVLSSEFSIIDSIKLIRKPKLNSLKDFSVVEEFEEYTVNINQIANYPIAEVKEIERTSLGLVGRLILRPIKELGAGKVKIYSKIILKVNFYDKFTEDVRSTSLLTGEIPRLKKSLATLDLKKKISSISNSQLSQGNWYKFEVQDAGIYKIDNNYLKQLNISYNDIAKLRIFGNRGEAIPDDPNVSFPDSLVEIARYVVRKNPSSSPSPEDFVVFYCRGATGWKYLGNNNFRHYINPYSDKNFYFFTIDQTDGRVMDSLIATDGPAPVHYPASFKEKIFVERELYNIASTGRNWVGKLFSGTDNSDIYRNSLPGYIASSRISYVFNFLRRSSKTDYINIYESGQRFIYQALSENTISDRYFARESILNGSYNGAIADNASVLRILVETGDNDSKVWLDWLEIYYDRKYEAVNDALFFTTPDLSGSVQYSISNLVSNEIYAFDVTSHQNVKRIAQLEIEQSNVRKFKLQQTGGTVREVAIVSGASLRTPPIAVKIPNSNLRSTQNQAEFIIITPTEFIPIANKLKNHRETMDDPLLTAVVDINHIYNEFNSGLPDPLAIRSFLKYAQQKWSVAPKYVLLLGNGYFDYKNILRTNLPNYIPAYLTEQSLFDFESFSSDDKFVVFKTLYSIAIGRIPARNYKEAEIAVNKIIAYEKNSPVSKWRNKITFVADDGKTPDADDGPTYINDTDIGLAENPNVIPSSFDKKKIYIVAYPTVNSSVGRRKPDANRDIVEAINEGCLITNFIGHGNERVWTHEAIFTREDEIPKLTNKHCLTLVFAATCTYGRYDDPKEISSGEKILLMEQGGAIVSIAASRKVFNGPNVSLNRNFYTNLLYKRPDGKMPRIGDAWIIAKQSVVGSLFYNTEKFHLFGDPSMRLVTPVGTASIDSVNNNALANLTNIKVKSLEFVNIIGTIKQANSNALFVGKANIQLLDSKRDVEIKEINSAQGYIDTYKFKVDGGPLFIGDISVENGKFKTIIPIPKDVNFGKASRLTLYAWNDNTDAVGFTEKITIEGVDSVKEFIGPDIKIFLEDYNFKSGDVVGKNPILIVRLTDESGINTSTAGVGHQLSAEINNPTRTYDLSSYYRSDLDTYKSGEVRYQLKNLDDGKYNLKVKAWDIYNNYSESEISFTVYSATDLSLLNMMNYPNPFSNSTTFTFQRNSTEPIEVEIKIYTIAGRLLNKFSTFSSERLVKIHWDGKDSEGDALANGIYFYKIIARSLVSKKSSEQIGKLAILK